MHLSDILAFWPIMDFLNLLVMRNGTFKGAFVANNSSIQGGKDKLHGRYSDVDSL